VSARPFRLATILIASSLLTAGIAWAKTIEGTPENDKLTGTAGADKISGGHGGDVIRGRGGPDRLNGGPDGDRIFGDAGDDKLFGGGCQVDTFGSLCDNPGREYLHGGKGNDLLLANACVLTFCAAQPFIALNSFFDGGPGDDRIAGADHRDKIIGGSGEDVMRGLRGRDTLLAADRHKDRVLCGGGRDRAVVDSIDVTRKCERVAVGD
jgi:Ca2+-binding RTX toxin-like protein